jgi:hypothetical protein
MKKILLLITAFALLCFNAFAQTSPADQFKSTTMGFWDSVTTASNWNAHIEALWVEGWKNHIGVREGFDYKISDGTYSTLSLVEGNNTIYGIAGNFGLKQHWSLFQGRLLLVTAEKVGVGNVLSGQKFGSFTVAGDTTHTGEWFGTIGSDVVFSPQYKYAPDIILGYEKFSNLYGNVYSVGVHMKLESVFGFIGLSKN